MICINPNPRFAYDASAADRCPREYLVYMYIGSMYLVYL